jgi:hypothetical protein
MSALFLELVFMGAWSTNFQESVSGVKDFEAFSLSEMFNLFFSGF